MQNKKRSFSTWWCEKFQAIKSLKILIYYLYFFLQPGKILTEIEIE